MELRHPPERKALVVHVIVAICLSSNVFRELPSGSATGGTAVIILDNNYRRGANGGFWLDTPPQWGFGVTMEIFIEGAASQRLYQLVQNQQGYTDTAGWFANNFANNVLFGDTWNQTIQNYSHPHWENGLSAPTFHGVSMAAQLVTRLQKYLLQPRLNSPDYGMMFEATARTGSYGNLLMSANLSDAPQTWAPNFATDCGGSDCRQSGQQFVCFAATYTGIEFTIYAATTNANTFSMPPDAAEACIFPVNFATELQRPVISINLADVPNATRVAVRYAYDSYDIDQRINAFDCGTGTCTLPIDRNIGTVYYRLIYLDSSSRVLAVSDVQTI